MWHSCEFPTFPQIHWLNQAWEGPHVRQLTQLLPREETERRWVPSSFKLWGGYINWFGSGDGRQRQRAIKGVGPKLRWKGGCRGCRIRYSALITLKFFLICIGCERWAPICSFRLIKYKRDPRDFSFRMSKWWAFEYAHESSCLYIFFSFVQPHHFISHCIFHLGWEWSQSSVGRIHVPLLPSFHCQKAKSHELW